MDFTQAASRSMAIREAYHGLERKHHGSDWSVEEDALAFLTDAALIGRLAMAQQERWPTGRDPSPELFHKIGESMWWLTVLAERMGMDSSQALEQFLQNKEQQLKG